MSEFWRSYRVEVCWLLLLIVLSLMTARRTTAQPDTALFCNMVMDTEDCDDPGTNCTCAPGEAFQ